MVRDHVGYVYFYPAGYVGSTVNLKARHKAHRSKHPDWSFPIILETVSGVDKEDLLFNLLWQETIWIFKKHTLRPNGLNKLLPFSVADYRKVATPEGRLKAARIMNSRPREERQGWGRKGAAKIRELYPELQKQWVSNAGKIGGKRTYELHPEMFAENSRKGGAIGGRIAGRKNVESGHLARISSLGAAAAGRKAVESGHLARISSLGGKVSGRQNVENGHLERIRHLAGRVSGRKHAQSGFMDRIRPLGAAKGGRAASHLIWHVRRGIVNPKCSLCAEVA